MLFPRVPDSDGLSFLRERSRRPEVAGVPVILTTAVGKGPSVPCRSARKATSVRPKMLSLVSQKYEGYLRERRLA